MDPHPTDPLGTQISTPNLGGALRLIGDTQDLPNSTRILYRTIHTCGMIFLPLLLESSDVATSGTFAPPHLIYVEISQILESSHSVGMI